RLHRRTAGLGVNAHGDAAAVVDDRDRAVAMNDDVHPVGEARHGFVDAVVHHFGHQVVQAPLIGAADVHARAAPNGFETFENLNVLGPVGLSHPLLVHRGDLRFHDPNSPLL